MLWLDSLNVTKNIKENLINNFFFFQKTPILGVFFVLCQSKMSYFLFLNLNNKPKTVLIRENISFKDSKYEKNIVFISSKFSLF